MSRKTLILAFILFIRTFTLLGQTENYSFSKNLLVQIDSIPFVLTEHNNIAVQATINKIDTVQLMLHTAANSVTIIKDVAQNLKSINSNGIDTVNSWGGDNSSKFSTKNSLQIGNKKIEDITIWENENSGPKTDGKFGLNFFENQIIEINFDENILKVYQYLPESEILKRGFEKFELIKENGFLFINATSILAKKDIINKFLIHSGFGGTILFDDLTAEKYGFAAKLKIIKESQLKDSYGNILKTKKAILPEFLIANQQLKNIPIGFFEGSIGRQKMSVIGGDILKRFNIVFDIQNSNIYLKPNKFMHESFSDI